MRNLPVITKSLLIANVVMWLLTVLFKQYGIYLVNYLGLFYYPSPYFHWWQPLTYMFMHANFSHLFFNMFAVLMFGPVLEQKWGTTKFLIYYIICGLGAGLVQELVWAMMGSGVAVTIGASGAVFGILLAFGWLFPDVPMFIFFIPIPIRARTLVIIYAVVEIFAGINPFHTDNVAHFAHLGGMLFGLILLLWWQYGHKIKLPRIFKGKKNDNERNKDYSDYHYHRSV